MPETSFHHCFIGLGSNLDDPLTQLDTAITALQGAYGISLLAVSGYYETAPIGGPEQPPFINAVAECSTSLEPIELLHRLQDIELRQGRVRETHWGPRTIDLDVLLFDDLQLDTPELTLPHPRLTERAFVLVPLADLAPELMIQGQPLSDWLEQVGDQSIIAL